MAGVHALWSKCAGCLSGVRTYVPGTLRQGCKLSKRSQNLPPGHYGAGLEAVKVVSEPIFWAKGCKLFMW